MTKRTETIITKQFTTRAHKQHSSLVITLPKGLCGMLEIVTGDHILFEVEPGGVAAVMGKVALRGLENARDKGNSNSRD